MLVLLLQHAEREYRRKESEILTGSTGKSKFLGFHWKTRTDKGIKFDSQMARGTCCGEKGAIQRAPAGALSLERNKKRGKKVKRRTRIITGDDTVPRSFIEFSEESVFPAEEEETALGASDGDKTRNRGSGCIDPTGKIGT